MVFSKGTMDIRVEWFWIFEIGNIAVDPIYFEKFIAKESARFSHSKNNKGRKK